VRKFGEQFGELASDVLFGANVWSGAQMCGERAKRERSERAVRSARSEGKARAAELVCVRTKCVTALTAHSMTARARARPSQHPPDVPSARQTWLTEHQTSRLVTPRLTYPRKRLRLSGLLITEYKTSHKEWGFTLLECILTRQNWQAGGEGVR
jgi:hypothetical protein